jgi:hypothetical protein
VLVKATQARDGLRDALMISLAWHHGLRVSELVDPRWSAIDWRRADIAVTRLKNGKDTRQPLQNDELRAQRTLYREHTSDENVFMSERGPFTQEYQADLAVFCGCSWPHDEPPGSHAPDGSARERSTPSSRRDRARISAEADYVRGCHRP